MTMFWQLQSVLSAWLTLGSSDDKGFRAAKARHPFPAAPKFAPFHEPLALAKGKGRDGRELLVDALSRTRMPLILELGVFLGGSLSRWHEDLPGVRVVGVDPFADNVTDYIDKWTQGRHNRVHKRQFRRYLGQLATPGGAIQSVFSNMWSNRSRTCIVAGYSPSVLFELSAAHTRLSTTHSTDAHFAL